jgi:hypothetical protein
MKSTFSRLTISIFLIILLTACNLPTRRGTGTDAGTIATKVAMTLAALTEATQQTPLFSPSPSTTIQVTNTQTPTQGPTVTTEPTSTMTATLTPTRTTFPTNTPIPAPGAIEGRILGYPYGSIPSLAVVAFKQNSGTYWFVITSPGNTFYSMTDTSNKGFVTPGSYQVVAYDASGNSGGCNTIVEVLSNKVVNCDIANWGGGYPAKPSGVPNP